MNETIERHPLSIIWGTFRPVVQMLVFGVVFLVLSLICIVPLALLTGKTKVGIWYILPFTVIFLIICQRFVHKERLSDLGLDFKKRWLKYISIGFAGSGLIIGIITAVQLSTGWLVVSSYGAVGLKAQYMATGVGLALLLNLGVGLGEELIFRGYILRRLILGYKTAIPGVIISATVFVIFHFQSDPELLRFINLFLLGIILALAVVLTKSLWLSIGIHLGWDYWGDGIFLYKLPQLSVSRVMLFKYNIHNGIELAAFKLITAIFLITVMVWLLYLIRGQYKVKAITEHLA